MNSPCDRLELYLDGELEPAEADEVQVHLPGCLPCQERLEGLVHLEAMAATAYAGAAPPAASPRRRPHWAIRPRVALATLALAPAAAVVAILSLPRPAPEDAELWLASGTARTLEARLSHGPADVHRPYVPMRGAQDVPRPVPLAPLARLEERGDLAGLTAAFLLNRERDLAASYLARRPASPERESDRAALALAAGAPEEALALASGALEARPRLPQALWNRALALRDLRLEPEAEAAFREIAGLGEAGWSEEAHQKAEAIARLRRDHRTPGQAPAAQAGGHPEALLQLRAEREQARRDLALGKRAEADRRLLRVVQGCRTLRLSPRCSDPEGGGSQVMPGELKR
jgi:hypothetical protein